MFGAARDVVQKCVLWMEINTFYANLAAEDFGRGAHRTWASLFFYAGWFSCSFRQQLCSIVGQRCFLRKGLFPLSAEKARIRGA